MARTTGLALAAAAALLVAFPAAAADSSGVQVIEAGTANFPDRTYVLSLPPGAEAVGTPDVTVTEDGKPVKGLAVLTSASGSGIGTVLLIDASNSMKPSIAAAMDAARTFAARNPGQPLSVVFFNSKPTVALPFSTDKAEIAAALSKPPKLAEGTHIYDALAAAAAQVRGSELAAARIVLLSDGDDVGSTTSLPLALSQLQAEGIRVYTVGLESPSFTPDELAAIAEQTGGTFASASSPTGLASIYDDLGFKLGNEYVLRYRSDAGPKQTVDVEVTVAGGEPVSFSYESPASGASGPYAPAFYDKLIQSWFLLPLLVAVMLGLVFFTVRSLLSLRSNKALVDRLGEFVTLPAEERALDRRKEVDALLAAVNQDSKRRLNSRWLDGFAEDCDVAQIERNPTRMIWLSVLVGLLIALIGGALVHPLWAILGVAPPIGLNIYVRMKARSTRDAFAEQLPENLDVLASALRAGHSLAGAMGVVADEAPEPSKREFTRVVTDEQLGIPLDEALEVTAQRMQNTDIDQVAVLALVQREAGGNTAEVLDQVTMNIRARMDIRRLVKVLTAQGKFSSVVVALVPVGIFLFIALVNPDHLDPLFHETVGQVASVMAILMVIFGFYVIRRIVSIEL